MGYVRRWNAYWFRPGPVINLAICRSVIVAYQLFHLYSHGYYGALRQLSKLPDFLYDPLPVLHLLVWPFGWTYRPPFEVLGTVFWITVAAGILALIGLKTNLSLAAFALGNVFLQAFYYSFGDFHHPDALMMIALTVLALSPAGRVLSVDDMWRRLQSNYRRGKFEPFNILDETSPFARWPLLLVQWMFGLIYLSAAMSKLTAAGPDWMTGYTLQYYLLQDGIRFGRPLGVWLAQHHFLAVALSWMTMLFEGTFFLVLIFPVLAWVYIPMGIGFYAGINLAMGATFFQHVALYVIFVNWAALIRAVSRRLAMSRSAKKPEIIYDGRCPLCIRSMTVLRYFDWFDRLRFSDLETEWQRLGKTHPELSIENCRREMHIVLPDGSVTKGFFAFREALKYLPPLWPLLVPFYLPFARIVGPKLYTIVASRRSRNDLGARETCVLHHDT